MIINVNGIINNLYVHKIVSFKYYMENICGYKVTSGYSDSIYQSGYFYNTNKGWMHISSLGNSNYIKNELVKLRNQKINKILGEDFI